MRSRTTRAPACSSSRKGGWSSRGTADSTAELGPGEFVGELTLLVPDAHRVARVRAATDVRVLAIRRDDFTALLEEEPALAVAMLPTLARRLVDVMQP